ncbi:MAG: hypothetical protein ACTS8H_02395 [Arsenophonus sp. NC-PE1-MAG3]
MLKNIKNQTLANIWQSQVYEDFKNLYAICDM